jgi:ribosomal protein S18 acetylase RimI-like enzyme
MTLQYLSLMNEDEFNVYLADKQKRYAETLEENTFEVTEPASLQAKKQLMSFLPNGFKTEQHEFFLIMNNGLLNGYVWLKIDQTKKSAFLYEIYLFEEFRSQGIGKEVLYEIEQYLKCKEIIYFKLHVFGTNEKAIKLYETIGFEVAGINMFKLL